MQEFERQVHTEQRRYHAAQLEWAMFWYPEPEPWAEFGPVSFYNHFHRDLEQELPANEWTQRLSVFLALFEAESKPKARLSTMLRDSSGEINDITNLRLYDMNNRTLTTILVRDNIHVGPASTDRTISLFVPSFAAGGFKHKLGLALKGMFNRTV